MVFNVLKKELTLSNCGFDHDPVDAIVRSQWQQKSKSINYLIYRWLVAAFVISVEVVALYYHLQKNDFSLFLIYLTRWGITMNMIVGIFGAVLVTVWHIHPNFKENILKDNEMPITFKIYWALHNIALVLAFTITIVYWTLLNEKMRLHVASILSHAMNSVIMFIDILIVSYPIRLYHVIQPMLFGACFGLFSYIYYACGGVNMDGKHYIYPILDWSNPGKALITTVGTFVLVLFIHVILFVIYKLRAFFQRRFFTISLDLTPKNY